MESSGLLLHAHWAHESPRWAGTVASNFPWGVRILVAIVSKFLTLGHSLGQPEWCQARRRFMESRLGLAPMLADDEPNIEHPTSNAERRTPKISGKLPSMLGVRCWALGVRLESLHGKCWRAARGGTVSPLTPALSPLRGEGGHRCPPQVWSLHSTRRMPVRARRRPTRLLQARRPRGALSLSPQRGEGRGEG